MYGLSQMLNNPLNNPLNNATSRSQPAAKRAGLPAPAAQPGSPALDLQARAADAAALLRALANPDRLLLLCQLLGGERSVSELGVSAGIGQPSLSQQLGVLRGERLVATRREGKQVIYRIASPAALTVLEALYSLFCDPAPAPAPGTAKAGLAARNIASRAGRKIA
jgi:ArsR family transcriptional regulator